MKDKIVVQIPCLNEESTIGDVITQFKNKIRNTEIIVYDNDSKDKSVEISKKHGVKVVTVMKRGKGNVVRRMFSDNLDAKFFELKSSYAK